MAVRRAKPKERKRAASDRGKAQAILLDGPRRASTAYALSRDYRLAPIVAAAEDARKNVHADRERFLVELAWDGHRVLACRVGKDVRLVSADFREWSDTFANVTNALRRFGAKDLVLEGFLCALDAQARPSFDLLRAHAAKEPARVVLALWDLLHVDGVDLRGLPLGKRRERLAALLEGVPEPLVLSEALSGDLNQVLAATAQLGVRGLVARSASGVYPPPSEEPWLSLSHDDAPLDFGQSLSPTPVITNGAKMFFPRDNLTKADMVAYYADVAAVMLPYMRERPVVCQRWPDGIDDFTWYQHRIPPRAPDYLRGVWIDGNRRIVIDNRESLLWLANQAAITFHGWASRLGSLDQPDWVVIDLDPGEATTWEDTIDVAIAVRRLLELLELPSVVKTSGQKGIHVLVPLAPGHTTEQAHLFARRAAGMVAQIMPDKVSLDSAIEKRNGRLFLDHLQSYVGKTLVLPYSLRAADGAPVSMPLAWSEVTPKLEPKAFNLRTLRRRLDAMGDLASPLLAGGAKLESALARMAGA